MIAAAPAAPQFLDRYRSVSAHALRVRLAQIVCGVLLIVAAGWGLLAWADFAWELGRPLRIAGLIAIVVAAVAYAGHQLLALVGEWRRPSTAADIEDAFPELGQAVRTTVQFGDWSESRVQAEGIATTLVAALAERTNLQTRPLILEKVVPTRTLWLMAGVLVAVSALLAGAAVASWEWRTALQRSLLAEFPYSELAVLPGDVTVDEGGAVAVTVQVTGRNRHGIVLNTRSSSHLDSTWQERVLEPWNDTPPSGTGEQQAVGSSDDVPPTSVAAAPGFPDDAGRPQVRQTAKLDRLTRELEYQASTGDIFSPIYRISLRRPLKVEELQVELTPPEYTGQSTSTVLDGNLSVLQGTQASYRIQFDKPVKSASLEFAWRKRLAEDGSAAPREVLSLEFPSGDDELDRRTGHAAITLNEDANFRVVADAADGTRLPEQWYRIRVREDQPPEISFESPADAVEVHSLAELPMRVRVQDDYGLTQAGIIFQVNNEQEVPLVQEDFAVVAAAAKEVETTGKVSPTTRTALERLLPLEHFELTQKDSVMYFAYAEDNRPNAPQRTETDLRFIDIRPFKRTYQVFDPDPMNGMGGGFSLKSLSELIQRQRFALNRTIQIEKRAAAGRPSDANAIDQLMQYETELAKSTRDTALGLESRGFDDTELFYQAEAAMLQAVDSLSVGKWENATLQMRDALKFLVEQRDLAALGILKNPDPARVAAIRAFDRMQAQKLRRPKTDKEEAKELIRRLEELAGLETAVSNTLKSSTTASPAKSDEEQPPPESEAEKPEAAVPQN